MKACGGRNDRMTDNRKMIASYICGHVFVPVTKESID